MKSLLFTLFFAVCTSGMVNAQETLARNGAKPGISFEETSHNFGEIEEGSRAKHTFKFENTGEAPLVIKNVRPSCGCTSPDWTRKPIQPGETGKVTAVYNSAGRPGKFHKSVTVYTNIEGKSVPLFIKGTVKRKNAN